MKGTRHITSGFLSVFLVISLAFFLVPERSCAQGFPSWWGSSSWFDWSDFRAETGVRLFLPKLHSAKIDGVAKDPAQNNLLIAAPGQELDLPDAFDITEDPSPFKELFFVLRVDRLALRYYKEDEQVFRGEEWFSATNRAMSELDVRATRGGLDIDFIRYPFLRVGINFDVQWEPLQFKRVFWDRFGATYFDLITNVQQVLPPTQIGVFQGAGPWDIGLHATAIPGRVRDVPVTIQGRFRYPMPLINQLSFLNRKNEAQITDVEVSVGMRPSVWDLSLYGYSTFSIGVEAGFRWQRLEINRATATVIRNSDPRPVGVVISTSENFPDVKIKGTWSGVFLQVTVVY